MIRRLLVLITAGAVIAGFTQMSEPHSLAQPEPSPIVGAADSEVKSGSTWFCPFGTAGIGDPAAGGVAAPQNFVDIAAVTDVSVTVTAFRTQAAEDATTTVTSNLEIAANSLATFDVGALADGGATVEISGGRATVAQRLVADNRSDQADCVSEAATAAYFASARTDEGATAQLWLTNPFPTDASVDLRITGNDGVRQPGPFRGLIVPARSSRLVDLSTPGGAELREQFAIAAEARSGRIVAGLSQTVSGKGLRITSGVQRPADTWVLPYSFTGAEVDEKVWIYNPGESDASVLISVMPQGVPAEMLPEPFTREIPARRYEVIDLPAEGRLPTVDLRWLQVEELTGSGVVVNHVVSLNGPSGDGAPNTRPALGGGLAAQVGASVQATEWTVTSLDSGAVGQSVVAITNPSPETIAVVSLTRIARSDGGEPTLVAENQEIAPLATLALDVSEIADVSVAVRVTSTTPVVVAARTTNSAAVDFALWSAVPVAETASVLSSVGG
ncbi:MAG: hypothetical protein GX868_00185 [Actinobacteria bacterium]|nr:hypothetical protein [Actinomycetota bacterium]